MPLTENQLFYVRSKIGDSQPPYVFSTEELNLFYDEFADTNLAKTIVECLECLTIDSAKLFDWKAGFTTQNESDIFDHLDDMLDYWRKKVSISNQVLMARTRAIPPRPKSRPHDVDEDNITGSYSDA